MNSAMTATMKLASKVSDFIYDGIENVLTGLGVAGKDKRLGARYSWRQMSQPMAESIHDSSDLAKLAVNKIPNLGTKKWIAHKVSEEQGGVEVVNKICDWEDDLDVTENFEKAWAWARLYGGAGIYISVDDGLKPEEALNLNRIVKINSLVVLHRWELQSAEINNDIDSKNYGLPDSYNVGGRAASSGVRIHHSRILRLDGAPLSEQGFKRNSYWNDSVLNVLQQFIKDYDSAYAGICHALNDFDVSVLKIKDLADIVSSDDGSLLVKRLQTMQMSKSIMSAIVLDAEAESFEKLERTFTGVEPILTKLDNRLVTMMELPHTVVLGEGSTGNLSGSGESENGNLNDLVASQQNKVLKKNITRFYKILMASKQGPTGGKILDSWTYDFRPLSEPTETQTVTMRKTQAETDQIYIDSGVVSANEVAKSRFAGDQYSIETNIDLEARQAQEETNNIGAEETNALMNGITPAPTPAPAQEVPVAGN